MARYSSRVSPESWRTLVGIGCVPANAELTSTSSQRSTPRTLITRRRIRAPPRRRRPHIPSAKDAPPAAPAQDPDPRHEMGQADRQRHATEHEDEGASDLHQGGGL